jgi:hypothetical protein
VFFRHLGEIPRESKEMKLTNRVDVPHFLPSQVLEEARKNEPYPLGQRAREALGTELFEIGFEKESEPERLTVPAGGHDG